MSKFDVLTETVLVADYNFPANSKQKQRAIANGAERVFRYRDIQGKVKNISKFVVQALDEAGYTPIWLGGSPYDYALIGLVPKKGSANEK